MNDLGQSRLNRMRASWSTTLSLGAVVAILLLASALRFHRLGAQSLGYDEGVAYAHSLRSLPEIVPLLQRNVHVPAYFTLLGWWQDLTGSSEFALRALSALFSVISVAWAYALGARLFHPGSGMAAAALVALNSFSIYYAQEARMYAMLTAVAGASMWLFSGFLRRRSRRLDRRAIVTLSLLNALGLYTHVVFALVVVAQGVLAAYWLAAALVAEGGGAQTARRSKHWLGGYITVNLITLVLFAPWLPISLRQISAQPNLAGAYSAGQALHLLLGHLAFGSTFEIGLGNLGFFVFFLLLLGLLPATLPRRSWWPALLPVCWALLSILAYLALDLTDRYLRFLLPAQLAFALWLGRGIWILGTRRLGGRWSPLRALPKLAVLSALGLYLLAQFNSLDLLYHDPAFQRDDMRGLARRIEADLALRDAVIVSAAGLEELLRYYYQAEAPVFGLPTTPDDAATRQRTLDIIADHSRLHVIFYGAGEQDPRQIVERTLNQYAFEISDEWVDDLRYLRYASPAALQEPQSVEILFGAAIRLRSYALGRETVEAGDVLPGQLVWTTNAPLSQRYKVFLQLLDEAGALVAQRDSEPAGGSAMTTSWQPGASIVDNHALLIPADLPAGEYQLVAGLYDIHDPSARLPTDAETYASLGMVTVIGRS